MRPGPLTATTQRLAHAQFVLHRIGGALWNTWRHRVTPDAFSREKKAEVAHDLQLAEFEVWHLSAWLPDRAPNDPAPVMPGAA